ncbi:MAG TPA: hypothetical protein H9986_03175, partial [Candidatus Prevotella stercoripullorum]|nr:hypothetical protein [Candidatus Prevotella stercoripullorum]
GLLQGERRPLGMRKAAFWFSRRDDGDGRELSEAWEGAADYSLTPFRFALMISVIKLSEHWKNITQSCSKIKKMITFAE